MNAENDRLDSWNAIADYLGRGVTTVQRWEQDEGLPIHRLPHAKKSSVFAFKSELDAWLAARAQRPMSAGVEAPTPTRTVDGRSARAFVVAASTVVAVVLVTVILSLTARSAATKVKRALVLPQPLANGVESEASPSLSPDGSHVVFFQWGSPAHGLFIKPIGGGAARRVPIAPEAGITSGGYPAWSPRGDLIAFLRREAAETRGLFVVSPEGGLPRRLTAIAGIGLCWSPDGEQVAFADRPSNGQPFSIFSISVSAGSRRRLTSPPSTSFGDTFCSFSPDGRMLAVVRHRTRYECSVHIVPLDDGDGSKSEQLTDRLNGLMGLAWAPDGTAIVAGASQGLWSIPVKTRAEPLLLAGLEGGAASPAFSRLLNGSFARLVYQFTQRDANVWRWDAGTMAQGQSHRVTKSSWFEDWPALSSDARLAFLSNQSGATEVWISDTDGSNAKPITRRHGPLVLSPQWSPDGRYIAFSSSVNGNRDIYLMAVEREEIRRVTSEPSEEGNPSWSHDGRWIYFRSNRDGVGRLWKTRRSGRHAVPVTRGEASQGFESADGAVLYFVRSVPESGIWSVPVSGGEERVVIPGVREGYWGIADRGIAYIPSDAGNPDGTFEIRFFDFASRTFSTLARLRPPVLPLMSGFAVSRDAKSVFWAQFDSIRDDVMLIDPWIP